VDFLRGLLRGLVINVCGVVLVYIIVSLVMAPRLPRDAKSAKEFISDMVNVKKNIVKMQNKSSDALTKPATKVALEQDNLTPEEFAKMVASQEVTPEEIVNMKVRMDKLQKQLDRIENQNRGMWLQLGRIEKQQQQTNPAATATQ
jgi:hypothetical protein